jgi:diguanylate cyclase (GGDEF)-like protein
MSIPDNGRENSAQPGGLNMNADAPQSLGEQHPEPHTEQHIADRESAVVGDEVAIRDREKLAASREDAAHSRENAAEMREESANTREQTAKAREGEARTREGAVTVREQQISESETVLRTFNDHVVMLRKANEHLVVAAMESQKLVESVQTAKMELDHLAHHDVLTNLPNRTLLLDRLTQAIELTHRQGKQLAVMFLDLDRFKYINDSLGHSVGDQLLQAIARRLVSCVRNSDTVSRQGGDEFILLLPSIEHAEDAALCAKKILAAFALPYPIDQHNLHIGVSIGISIYPDDGRDADSLISSADTAMYHAKESGRENFKFFEQEMNDRAVQRQSIEASLRLAIERQEFVLHYQPKVDLRSGAIVGCEALIRWQHPELGLLSPGQFVSIAEDCGLILPIGRWVLREACRQAIAWRKAGLLPIVVAVNTSALELRSLDFLENIRTTLAETGMEPQYLELELTESVLMHDAESSNSALIALHALGTKLAIDDFGTGYSSLSYLRRFPIDTLKIDQSFVNHITSNKDDATIVCSVVSLGKSLNKRVIAEGVETREQYAFLLDQECDEGQGYFLGRPVVAAALATLLQSGESLSLHGTA